MAAAASDLAVRADGVLLSGEQSGGGDQGERSDGHGGGGEDVKDGEQATIVLLHGLTATRRYVVMGSSALERAGRRVIAYDARGHGRSSAAAERAYGYGHLAEDLGAVLDAVGLQRAVLAGASMGAHTAVRFALAHPERVQALAIITPAYEPDRPLTTAELARWDALAQGLREGGVDGFLDAYELTAMPEIWRETLERVLRQRIAAHEHPEAVADALEVVPRSHPFADIGELGAIAVPTIVVASRDGPDPGHPLAVGERYAAAIPGARLIVEEQGPPARSPIAWQGGQLSKLLIELMVAAEA